MANYMADLVWTLQDGEDFEHGRYRRAHRISFDGGVKLPASASPHAVGKWADKAAVDPEELLVAAIASCHMLSFLQVARLAGFAVQRGWARIRCTEPEAPLGAAQRLFSSTGAERPGGREHRSAENSLWMAGAVEFLPSLFAHPSACYACWN
jgi:hypothetical protein